MKVSSSGNFSRPSLFPKTLRWSQCKGNLAKEDAYFTQEERLMSPSPSMGFSATPEMFKKLIEYLKKNN